MISLFNINDDNELEVDNLAIYSAQPFRDLLTSTGKDTILFQKIISFVYFYYDYFSPFAVEPDERKLAQSLSASGLLEEKSFNPKSSVIIAAAKFYQESQESMMPSVKMYKSLNAGIVSSSKAIDVLRKNIDALTKAADNADGMVVATEALMDNVTTLIAITSKLESAFKTLGAIEDKLRNEKDSTLGIAKGDKKVSLFEDEDPDLDK